MNPVLIMMFLLVPTVGGLLAATPWLMPRNECFAVTVPASAHDDPRLAALRGSYLRAMLLTTIACMLAWVIVPRVAGLSQPDARLDSSTLALLMCITICAPIVVSFALMLRCRSRVQAIKREEGWTATGPTSAAVVGEADVPKPISLAWNLLYLPVVASFVIIAFAMYDAFPEQIPMHIDFDGTVTNYAEKSIGTVLFPALMAAFMGIVFATCHWMIVRSKKPVDPAAPHTSALAYGAFARIQSVLLLVGGVFLCVTTGAGFFLAALGAMPLGQVALLMLAAAVAFLAVYLVASIVYGQSGARIAGQVEGEGDGLSSDNDRYWKLGIFYVNPNDPSVIVPKRFGMGWTTNFGRPTTWVLLAALGGLVAGFVVLSEMIAG